MIPGAMQRVGTTGGLAVAKLRWALAVLVLASTALTLPAEAAEKLPEAVTLRGVEGTITAWPATHRVQAALEGFGTVTFENANIVVRPGRIRIVARTRERTLFAWANRTNSAGAIGMLVRQPNHRARPQTMAVLTEAIVFDGTVQLTRH